MEKVFEKELLLETILKNLGPRDLKVARRVSKRWSYRSTRILLRKHLLKVTHAFQHNPNDEHAQKLLALETTIKESPLFPSCSFAFSNCNLSSQDVQHVLSTFGHLIHTLNISLDSGNLPGITGRTLLHSFKHVLCMQLPNLEELTLESKITLLPEPEISEDNNEETFTSLSPKSSKSELLKKLKFLRVQSALPVNIFEFIIQAGVNISEVELSASRHEQLVDVLGRTNKIHLLSSTFISFQKDNLLLIERFCKANLNLRTLQIFLSPKSLDSRDIWLQATKIMATLLHKCAHSLDLMITPPLFYLQQFEVPVMPQLRELIIFILENCPEAFEPKGFKMSRVFPRLSCIFTQYPSGVRSSTWSKEMYEKSFLGADYQDSVSTLTALQFVNEPEFACIQKWPLLFPNIKKLLISQLIRVSQVLHVFWSLPMLALLEFGVSIETLENLDLENASWNTKTNSFTALDAALTGICEETCADFGGSSDSENLDAEALKGLRLKTSMLDAKCLRHLIVGIEDDSSGERTSPTKAVLSKVASKYAFDLCPNVKVEIILRAKQEENVKYLLAGISPLLKTNAEIKKENKTYTFGRITFAKYIYKLTF